MNHNCISKKHAISGKRPSGFSLIELLIAMALSIILLGGVVTIYTNSKQTYNVQEGLSRLQENARFAMDRLNKEISSAGYMGCLPTNPTDNRDNLSGTRITNVLTIQQPGTVNDFTRPVFGVDNAGPNGSDTITLIRARGQSGIPVIAPMLRSTDNITIDSTHPNYANLARFNTISISDCSKAVTFMITNNPLPAPPPANAQPPVPVMIQHRTGVADPNNQSNASPDLGGITFGTLGDAQASVLLVAGRTYTIGNSAQGVCAPATLGFCSLLEDGIELVEGVEDFQVQYGEDTSVPIDTSADVYRTANNVVSWNNVVSVRITLTVNEVERAQGSGNGQTNANTSRTYTNTIRIRSRGV